MCCGSSLPASPAPTRKFPWCNLRLGPPDWISTNERVNISNVEQLSSQRHGNACAHRMLRRTADKGPWSRATPIPRSRLNSTTRDGEEGGEAHHSGMYSGECVEAAKRTVPKCDDGRGRSSGHGDVMNGARAATATGTGSVQEQAQQHSTDWLRC